jgi:metal-responsive CopG/Arc/MetJ family transcriptional regulator
MHVHACQNAHMRTTVEIPNALRARLLELAARRGEKGFSNLVREAVEAYLAGAEAREEARRSAVQVLGTVSDDDADRMAASVRRVRERWR